MRKKVLVRGIVLLMMLILIGCGNASSSTQYSSEVSQDSSYTSAAESAADTGSKTEESADAESDIEVDPVKAQDKLVYTCDISLQTLEYDTTIKKINSQIQAFDGILQSQSESDSNTDWYMSGTTSSSSRNAYITVRIPTDTYEEFLESIEGNGKVINKSINVENISKTYYDTKSVIESLKIQEKRLLEMMEQSTNIEDMIAVEARLTEVQIQLNQYNTELASMDTDVEYSTINISVEEVLEYSVDGKQQKNNTFIDRLKNTISDSWSGFLTFLEVLLFIVIRLFPIILFFGVVALPVVWFVRKRKKKKAVSGSAQTAAQSTLQPSLETESEDETE
ncbi:MAG: DUF4349 domain-containing protein [Lachnospiraceae bacterium]